MKRIYKSIARDTQWAQVLGIAAWGRQKRFLARHLLALTHELGRDRINRSREEGDFDKIMKVLATWPMPSGLKCLVPRVISPFSGIPSSSLASLFGH